MNKKIFYPSEELVSQSNIRLAMNKFGFSSYEELYNWSIDFKEQFIAYSIAEIGVKFEVSPREIVSYSEFGKKVNWLSGASLNIVESCFLADENKVAFKFMNESLLDVQEITYGELKSKVKKYSQGLRSLGYKKEDRCAIYMPMNVESVCIYLAMIAIGVVVVLIPDSFSVEELEKRLKLADCSNVFTCFSYIYNKKNFILADKVRSLTACNVVYLGLFEAETVLENETVFENVLLGIQHQADFCFEYVEADYPISILFSSGTTKDPKMIPWSHITPMKAAIDAYYHLDLKADDVVTWTTGMGWMMAPWLFFSVLINQATLAIYEGAYHDSAYGAFLEKAKVSVLGVIPSLVKIWHKTKVLEQFELNIRVFASTGEPSDENDYLYLQELSNCKAPIIEYCGGTEIGGAYITNTVVEPSYISSFSTPTLGTELVFLNSNNCCAEVGEVAEVMIVPPAFGLSQELLNYVHDAEYYDEREGIFPEKILRKHGDVYKSFEIEGLKFYKCRGRSDDTFNLNGIKVSAVEIEEIAKQHEAIDDVAAVSTSGDGPEKLILFYTSTSLCDADDLLVEVQSLISKKLNPLYRVSRMVKIESMPRTASNKLMRKELRAII